MKLDQYSRCTISDQDAITMLLEGKNIENALFELSEDVLLYNQYSEDVFGNERQLCVCNDLDIPVDLYHKQQQKKWLMPEEYKNLNILQLLIDRCKTDVEIERVASEYILYEERNLVPLLNFLHYFRDFCNDNKFTIGVGRGSSVSSYCLYLLGIHKVDSLKYDLDIREFLK